MQRPRNDSAACETLQNRGAWGCGFLLGHYRLQSVKKGLAGHGGGR